MRTTIYGYIEEMKFWSGPIQSKVFAHNLQVFNSLLNCDEWPPLSREMFAMSKNNGDNPGPNLEYGGRIIHFGANLKSIESDWEEWKKKFEIFLEQLYFIEAVVHFKPEYSKIQTNEWSVDLQKYQIRKNDEMPDKITRECWIYESTWEN